MPDTVLERLRQETQNPNLTAENLADFNPEQGANIADSAIVNTTALTDNGGGTANDTVEAQSTFAPSVAWNGSSVYPSAADATALTAIALAARNNMKEVTTQLAIQRTANAALEAKINAIIAALEAAGITASS
jgi:hypothetical protein